MGLLNAMAALAEEWDDVLSHLDTDQGARLRGLVTRFVDESDPDASSEISEAIMNLLLEGLPVTHPVLSALMISEDRFRRRDSLASDSAWLQLAGPLRLRLGAAASPGGSAPRSPRSPWTSIWIPTIAWWRPGSLVRPTLSSGSLGMTARSMKR